MITRGTRVVVKDRGEGVVRRIESQWLWIFRRSYREVWFLVELDSGWSGRFRSELVSLPEKAAA